MFARSRVTFSLTVLSEGKTIVTDVTGPNTVKTLRMLARPLYPFLMAIFSAGDKEDNALAGENIVEIQ